MQFLTPLMLLPALALAAPLETNGIPNLSIRSFGYNPGDITISQANTSGNGCPQGSTTTTPSDDKETVTFGFDKFQAYIGPTASQSDKSKNCQLHLNLKYPGGLHFTVLQSTYHGWARLDAGVNASFVSTYYFSQAASHTAETRKFISGDDTSTDWTQGNTYDKVDTVKSASVIWSPCGANGILNINNRISLALEKGAPSTAAGELSDDDATVSFTQQVNLAWQPCDPSASSSQGSTYTTFGADSSFVET
ncbi:hypothetical protein N431DRAFT_558038 [Stipitochalara longipes BDJ]|nr:hypothetical protein N431DRAFT_558038 [Stipitochalara longipes BDJ]